MAEVKRFTINALLSMNKALQTRRAQLETVKQGSLMRTRFAMLDRSEKIEEPQYDAKAIDARIVEINNALYVMDVKIKESNAKTSIALELDFDKLMSIVG